MLAHASYEFAVRKSSNNQEAPPIITIHGIFGSKSNCNSLSKVTHEKISHEYLLTNLVEAEAGKYKWRVNLPVFEANFVKHITALPRTNKTFNGPTLFIGGSQSNYVSVDDHEKNRQLFPVEKIQYIQGATTLLRSLPKSSNMNLRYVEDSLKNQKNKTGESF